MDKRQKSQRHVLIDKRRKSQGQIAEERLALQAATHAKMKEDLRAAAWRKRPKSIARRSSSRLDDIVQGTPTGKRKAGNTHGVLRRSPRKRIDNLNEQKNQLSTTLKHMIDTDPKYETYKRRIAQQIERIKQKIKVEEAKIAPGIANGKTGLGLRF